MRRTLRDVALAGCLAIGGLAGFGPSEALAQGFGAYPGGYVGGSYGGGYGVGVYPPAYGNAYGGYPGTPVGVYGTYGPSYYSRGYVGAPGYYRPSYHHHRHHRGCGHY